MHSYSNAYSNRAELACLLTAVFFDKQSKGLDCATVAKIVGLQKGVASNQPTDQRVEAWGPEN